MPLSLFHLCLVLKMNELKCEHEQDPFPPVGTPQITQRFCARALVIEPGAWLHGCESLSQSQSHVFSWGRSISYFSLEYRKIFCFLSILNHTHSLHFFFFETFENQI